MITESESLNPEISKVVFRASPIMKENVELWFYQIEAHFKISGITSESTMFCCTVSALDVETLSYVCDLIRSPRIDRPYQLLKDRICKQYAQPENARLHTLLQDLQLGDQRPSQILHQMQILGDNKISEDIIKQL